MENSCEIVPLCPAGTDSGADTNKTSLQRDYRVARDSLTRLDSIIGNLLNGQGGIGRKAAKAAYGFTVGCMDSPANAAKLPGWENAAVRAGANPYNQPLKLLAKDMDKAIAPTISIWAKVFRHAHEQGIEPGKFLENLNRNHGMRQWYDSINRMAKATNDKCPTGDSGGAASASGQTAAEPISVESKPAHVDITERMRQAKHIAFVIVDLDTLVHNAIAKADFESNPAFIGIALAGDSECRTFVYDTDSRFDKKVAA